MGHFFHLKHDHDHDWPHDVAMEASDTSALAIRNRMGYPDWIVFFEEAPAGVLAHEALAVLERACPSWDRVQQEVISGQPWATYETIRAMYLTAALVFGRADLLAVVLMDCSTPSQCAVWRRFFSTGEVHRTLPAEVLNTELITDLHGDRHRVPVWVAMLLASRPFTRRYRCVLRRLAKAGATGFHEHLYDKHPVLMNREALNAAIDVAEQTVKAVASKEEEERKAQRRELQRATARDTGRREGGATPTDDRLSDGMERYLHALEDDIERRTADAQALRSGVPDGPFWNEQDAMTSFVTARFATWGYPDGMTLDAENVERVRLGLPPRVVLDKVHERREAERQLHEAVQDGRASEVKRLLLAGADPETPNYIRGIAMVAALNRKGPIAGMLIAHGANPSMRTGAGTLLSMVCEKAFRTYSACLDEEQIDIALDLPVQMVGLLVRAGATASQFNVNLSGERIDKVSGTMAPDAWHWIRQVPDIQAAYEQAVAYRESLREEADRFVASLPQIVRDYPEQVKQAEQAVAAMLEAAKGTAKHD